MCITDLSSLSIRITTEAPTKVVRSRLNKLFKVIHIQELALRSNTSNQIGRNQFLKFFNLPGLIAEQFFNALDLASSDNLDIA